MVKINYDFITIPVGNRLSLLICCLYTAPTIKCIPKYNYISPMSNALDEVIVNITQVYNIANSIFIVIIVCHKTFDFSSRR